MREQEVKVELVLPQASELTRLEKKHLVDYVNIGPPVDKDRYGTEPRIQLDDQFAGVEDIPTWIENNRKQVAEVERPSLTTSIKVDKNTKMGIVTAVKQELRQANALKINYSTVRRSRTGSEDWFCVSGLIVGSQWVSESVIDSIAVFKNGVIQ